MRVDVKKYMTRKSGARKKPWQKKIWPVFPPVLIIVIAFAAYFIMISTQGAPQKRPPRVSLRQVEVMKADVQTARTEIHRSAYLETGPILSLKMEVDGIIQSLSPAYRTGEWVEKGQVLVTLDPYLLNLALIRAEARQESLNAQIESVNIEIQASEKLVSAARRQVNLRSKDVARRKKLAGRGASSTSKLEESQRSQISAQQELLRTQQTFDIKKALLLKLQADLKQIDVDIAQAEYDLKNTVLYAPFSGFLEAADMSVGQKISRSDVMVKMINPAHFQVPIPLSQKDLSLLMASNPAQAANFWQRWDVEAEFRIGGQRVGVPIADLRLDSRAPDRAGGMQFRGFLFADQNVSDIHKLMRPGMFARVTVKGPVLQNVLKVPRQIVQMQRANQYDGVVKVITVHPEGKSASLQQHAARIVGGIGEDLLLQGELPEESLILSSKLNEFRPDLKVRLGAGVMSMAEKDNQSASSKEKAAPQQSGDTQ